MAEPMQVEVVSADQVVWSGEATNIIATTVDGDVGILPGHSPLIGVLVPGAVVIYSTDNTREIVAVDGGFISVAQGRVSVLSQYASMAQEISVAEAEKELADAQARLDAGEDDEDTRRHFRRANAQVVAAQKAQ